MILVANRDCPKAATSVPALSKDFGIIRQLLSVLATSFVAQTALAQTVLAPAFLECKTDIGIQYYQVAPDNLSRWYAEDRRWGNLIPCSRGRLVGVACSFTVTDTKYDFDDRSEDPVDRQKFWNRIMINHVSGAYSEFNFASAVGRQAEFVSRVGGTCTKTTDPSLQPKPVPAM